ncbi:RTX toxins and related Ca2+-binding protein [Candidatus Burkholderia verschuerenii]|uniref:RTX toxins and related Ca2+-binding protein n=1 Tax=Candidatus Burkholderia verschuerenii TaxID=242163 RepID=A0A0L0MIX4_9BURK|nr:RTX toxins and related Ca2+-binding protein [Candidatus Burkholderia verschuerenii]
MLPQNGKPAPQPSAVLIASHPTELVTTDGPAKLEPVAGTSLLTITNTDHAVFVLPQTNQYYVLVSGRWFAGASEKGPWTYVAGRDLPKDFAKISPHDPKANVLVSVPDTPQAKEAAIAATIPQTATVSRAKASLAVHYDGAPHFESIQGTSLQYAVNTATPVIEVSKSQYYSVQSGVWFVAAAPTGPWAVATEVPGAIYTIPVQSPLHYVTYVQIYNVMPTTVVVGYTPGYTGVMVGSDGTVVYGTGYVYQPYVGATYYYGYPPTYGYDAGFAMDAAAGFAFGFAVGAIWGSCTPYWGPYWGGGWGGWGNVNINQTNFYGRWGNGTVTHVAGYNPWTGNEFRGAAGSGFNPATGTHWQGARGAAFNPYNGNFAAGRGGSFANPSTRDAKAGAVRAWQAT